MSVYIRYQPLGLGGGGGGSSGIRSINADTTSAQILAVGSAGTDFAIVDDGAGTHTFNLPNASATARGVVSTGTQIFAGAKTFNSTVAINAASTIGALTVKALGAGVYDGITQVSSGGGGQLGIVVRDNSDVFIYNGSATILNLTGSGFAGAGPASPSTRWESNGASSGTTVTSPGVEITSTVRNIDSTVNNLSAKAFVNSANEQTSLIVGVHESQTPGSATGHISMVVANAGTKTERFVLSKAGLIQASAYGVGAAFFDSSGNLSSGTLSIANGGTGQTTANAAFNALVPSQTSNSGKYLTTNGTNTSWATVASSGANTTLSNLGTTAINANLISGIAALTVIGLAGTAGGTVSVVGGQASSGQGGLVQIKAGNGSSGGSQAFVRVNGTTTAGGDIQLVAGDGATGGNGGNVNISPGSPGSGGAAGITTINGAITTSNLTSGFLKADGSGVLSTSNPVSSVTFTGDGTVLSSTPSSAVTTTGTLTAALATQAVNTVLAGPASGSAAAPTFRALTSSDQTVQTTSAAGALNLGLASSVAANALTIALKQNDGSADASSANPVVIGFRNATATSGAYNRRAVTAALSIVVPASATLGHVSAMNQYVWVYAMDNAGTVELAVSGVKLFPDKSIASSTTISSGATSGTVLYSTTGRSNLPIRLIGQLLVSEATAGNWATAPADVVVMPVPSVNITDWVAYTPVFTGFGSVITQAYLSRRVGDTLQITGKHTTATATGVEARIALGFNGTSGNVTAADTTRIPAIKCVGGFGYGGNAAFAGNSLIEPSVGYFTLGAQSSTQTGLNKLLGTDLGTGSVLSPYLEVPILGWSTYGP